jgi:hypothetical protein
MLTFLHCRSLSCENHPCCLAPADSLLAAVDSKARATYRSRAQAALHMLNNAQFLAHAARGKELKAVAETWLDAHKVGLWRWLGLAGGRPGLVPGRALGALEEGPRLGIGWECL